MLPISIAELMSKVNPFYRFKDSLISLVRVATNIEEFSKSRDLIQILRDLIMMYF